jgi:hypothetical protein
MKKSLYSTLILLLIISGFIAFFYPKQFNYIFYHCVGIKGGEIENSENLPLQMCYGIPMKGSEWILEYAPV